MDEGFDRHDAIHAIGSILMGNVFDADRKAEDADDINAKYKRELATLTATGW